MLRKTGPENWALIALIGACTAAAQTGRFYADILPDTVQPGAAYVFGTPPPMPLKVSADPPARWPDTVDLKRGATAMRIIGTYGLPGFSQGYRLTVPINAAAGSYDAYSPRGVLLETGVTFVPDVRNMAPRLTVKRTRGLRGGSYTLAAGALGPAFGPLGEGRPVPPALRYAALESGKDTLPFRDIDVPSPYDFKGSIDVPPSAGLGPYRMVVERQDGVRTEADSVFEVWLPPAPRDLVVSPDSVSAGDTVTLGITGTNLDYAVRQGSDASLDRNVVKRVYLRNGEARLFAKDYPLLASMFSPMRANILARFDVPERFPAGACDLGIVIAGRPDTAYLPGAVRVLWGPSRLVSFLPGSAWREPFMASVETRYLRADPAAGAYSLRRGNAVIRGTFSDTADGNIRLSFGPDSASDSGWYDFEADFPGLPALGIPHAVLLSGPRLDGIRPMGWAQGEEDTLSFRLLGAGSAPKPPEGASIPDAADLKGVWLCQGSRCLEGSGPSPLYLGWKIGFRIPSDWTPGAYDVVVRLLHPERMVVMPDGIVIAPAGYRALLPAPTPYWDLRADSTGKLGLDPGPGCPAADYRPEAGSAAGPALSAGLLQWTPAAADTGWHAFRFAGGGTCADRLFLMAFVRPDPGVAARPAPPGAAEGTAGRASWKGGRLELSLPRPAQAELRTASGRLLMRLGRLGAGEHGIALPLPARAEAVLLCRLRGASGETWLRIPRAP